MRLINTNTNIVHTKTTAVQNEVALCYHKVRGQYFLAVVFAATSIVLIISNVTNIKIQTSGSTL